MCVCLPVYPSVTALVKASLGSTLVFLKALCTRNLHVALARPFEDISAKGLLSLSESR